MSKCIVLGQGKSAKIRQVGHNRSHANNATKRVFNVNIQKKKYTLSDGTSVRVDISTKGIRIIDKKGVAFLEQLLKAQAE
ncbi:50S ribosomal protein L28 [Candidatus Synchoanobacter obligatus]|uniref:Large ribosomal subunit protein bL28 n=1 Tax=Candidatus Synchoanobacter obligatus TaxID=2919597 RepID=A0ABT1L522_9GAMM|nr:50S ribosomal protein L28 [Candidatus Synchoanobacter obligatus]MCP8352280.1 50S ribosomal protein L28 [Candidatus Synchoanobacter obligatus]